MKKIFIFIIGMMVFFITPSALADSTQYYAKVTFDDNINPFTEITNSGTQTGSVVIVNAADENIGTKGKVLKVKTGKNNSFSAKMVFSTPISIENNLVFEAKIQTTSDQTLKRLFTLNANTNRDKPTGLACVRRIGSPHYKQTLFPSTVDDNVTGFLKDIEDETLPVHIQNNKWYRVKIFFSGSEVPDGERIVSLQLFDESGNLIQSTHNLTTQNSPWPLQNIAKIGFGSKAWDTEEIFYIDDVYVYESKDDADIILAAREGIEVNEFANIDNGWKPYLNVIRTFTNIPDAKGVKTSLNQTRPRLIANSNDIQKIKKSDNSFVLHMNRKLKEYGEGLLTSEPLSDKSNTDLLALSRNVLDRCAVLGYLYQITGDAKYAQAAEKQLVVSAMEFLDWTPYPALQVGEMMTAISIGYDWCYNELSQSAKTTIENCVVQKLQTANDFYYPTYSYCATQENNWNPVFNGGYMMASIAFSELNTDDYSKIISSAIDSVQLGIASLAKGGAGLEGPGYWAYQMQYTCYILSTLDSVFNSDFGLSDIPGFSEAWKYPIQISSSEKITFNYFDVNEGSPQIVWNYYFAKKFNASQSADYARKLQPEGVNYSSWEYKHFDILAALWSPDEVSDYKTLPTSAVFEGKQPAVSFRENWDEGSLFVAMKGGKAFSAHGHLDAGSFVLDAMGVRWACDLGSENYSGEGLSDFSGGTRWNYYMHRAEGHNTLTVNSTAGADQNPYGIAKLLSYSEKEKFAEFDLTELYGEHITNAKRSVKLDTQSRKIIITDDITPVGKSDIKWYMHTKQTIELINDGQEAKLSNGNKVLKAKIISPVGAAFTIEDAKSVWSGVSTTKDLSNVKKLVINVNTSDKTQIKVVFEPEYETFEIAEASEIDRGTIYNEIPDRVEIIFTKQPNINSLSNIKVMNHLGTVIPITVHKSENPFGAYIDFTLPLAKGAYYKIDIADVTSVDGEIASGKTAMGFGLSADNGKIFSYDFEDGSPLPETFTDDTSQIYSYEFGGSKSFVIRHTNDASSGMSAYISSKVTEEYSDKALVFEAQVTITKRGDVRDVFGLYNRDGGIICNSIFRINPTAVEEGNWSSANIIASDESYFMSNSDSTKKYLMDINVPHLFRAIVEPSGNSLKLKLIVINLENFETMTKEINLSKSLTYPLDVRITQRAWSANVTYVDNFKAFLLDSQPVAQRIGNKIIIDNSLSNILEATIYKATFNNEQFASVKTEEIFVLPGRTEITYDEAFKIFLWTKQLIPLMKVE